MQVRKFEAKTMKEALELVKAHMGPEAIILSAKDNHRGFGLVGGTSVEVTAAVTDEVLKRKLLAEKKMREGARERFQRASAKDQKKYLNKSIEKAMDLQLNPKRPTTSTPYIDIEDESPKSRPGRSVEATTPVSTSPRTAVSQQREPVSRNAAFRGSGGLEHVGAQLAHEAQMRQKNSHVEALEYQIKELKGMIEKFQKVPQSFVNAHPGAEDGVPYHLTGVYQRMLKRGVDSDLVVRALRKAQSTLGPESSKKSALVEAWMVQHFMRNLDVVERLTQDRYQVFVGSTGQGKTTSLVKIASHLLMKEKKRIAIVSMDTMKVGASDQLKIYAQILNVPFAVVRNPGDWSILENKLDRIDHILVDAPGFTLKLEGEMSWLKERLPNTRHSRRIHWVQSIVARDEEVMGLAERYSKVGFDDVIFTRVDESSRQGMILNFQNQFKKPILGFGTGVQIPEDFNWANKEKIADLIFRITG